MSSLYSQEGRERRREVPLRSRQDMKTLHQPQGKGDDASERGFRVKDCLRPMRRNSLKRAKSGESRGGFLELSKMARSSKLSGRHQSPASLAGKAQAATQLQKQQEPPRWSRLSA